MENFMTRISKVQEELKAPKSQFNKFGKYNYRSCEDILEAVKPILRKNSIVLIISDDIVNVGDRYYVKATATLYDLESVETVGSSAFAKEPLTQAGMSDSQLTGTASSYARKYALNGLFNIDDTKDADTDEFTERANTAKTKASTKATPTKKPFEFRCLECGKPFKEFTDKNGKVYTPEQQYAMTGGRCSECRKKAQENG